MTDDGHFDAHIAATYDDDPAATDPELNNATTSFLAELASAAPLTGPAAGTALEFAIGTGRIALPLALRGIAVRGNEISQAMVADMRAKPGGADITVDNGDMTTTRSPGPFALVYLVFNTINNLTTQDAQTECFINAARHLAPGGHFVVEVMVPELQRLPAGERFVPFDVSDDHWGIDEYDVLSQAMTSHHLHRRDGALVRNSVPFRYVWPSELDLMARIAGLSLTQRVADWHRAPFTATSPSHISVWKKPV